MTPPFLSATRQSPIDVEPALKVTATQQLTVDWRTQRLVFEPKEKDGKVSFGHTANPNATVTLGGQAYVLRELHFHTPSEHFRSATQYAGELHIVHQHPQSGRFCVLGFFLKKRPTAPSWIDGFFPPRASSATKRPPIAVSGKELAPSSKDLGRYYRYQGSLTTAPFAETVSWIVFPDPLDVSKDTLGRLGAGSGGARVLQARDERQVLLVSRPSRGTKR